MMLHGVLVSREVEFRVERAASINNTANIRTRSSTRDSYRARGTSGVASHPSAGVNLARFATRDVVQRIRADRKMSGSRARYQETRRLSRSLDAVCAESRRNAPLPNSCYEKKRARGGLANDAVDSDI